MTITRRLFLASGAALVPGAAFAHHGWGSYDTARAFTVTGSITRAAYENPHCEIEVQAEGRTWRFVLAPPSRMRNRGVTPQMIAPGKTCTVYGYPHRTDASEARIEYIVLDGGRYQLR